MTQVIKNNIDRINSITSQSVMLLLLVLILMGAFYSFLAVNKAMTTSRLMLLEKQTNSLLSDISSLEGDFMKKQADVTMNTAKKLGFEEVAVKYIDKTSGIALSLNNEIR